MAKRSCPSDAVAVIESLHEVGVHSQILCLASPVFDAMLHTEMQEGSNKRFKVDHASKDAFVEFYSCLLPCAKLPQLISADNVENILPLADYYQVCDILCIEDAGERDYEKCESYTNILQIYYQHITQLLHTFMKSCCFNYYELSSRRLSCRFAITPS